jgi:hypothetical protein
VIIAPVGCHRRNILEELKFLKETKTDPGTSVEIVLNSTTSTKVLY